MRIKLTKCLLAPMWGHKGAQRSLEVLEVPLVTALMEARLEEWVLFSGGSQSLGQRTDLLGKDHKKLPAFPGLSWPRSHKSQTVSICIA